MQKCRVEWFGWIFLLLLVACQPIAPPGATAQPQPTSPPISTLQVTVTLTTLPTTTVTIREEPAVMPTIAVNPQAEQAINDLAERLQVDPQTIAVVRVEAVTWPDGSLGCPQPGMIYTQALVNGSFIQLQVGDQLYNYHSGGRRTPFLCESPEEVLPEELGEGPA